MGDINSAELSGKPDSSGWSQAQELRSDDSSLQRNKGNLFAVLSIESSQSDEKKTQLGQEVLAKLKQSYFSETFEIRLAELKKLIEDIVRQSGHAGVNVELGVASLVNGILYVVAANGARLVLLRGGSYVEIVKTHTGSVVSASGRVHPGDSYLLATKNMFTQVSKEVLQNSLGMNSSDLIIESLAPVVHSFEGTGLVSALSIQIANGQSSVNKNYSIVSKTSSIRRKLAGKLDQIITKIPERRITVVSDSRDLSVRRNKKPALVGAMLLILLAISIIFGTRHRADKVEREKYTPRLEEAKHEYEEAKSLADLNTPRARELILSARDKLESIKSDGVEDPAVLELSSQIVNSLGEIAGIYELEPELFLDLSLIRAEFTIEDMSYSSGAMRVLDANSKRVVDIDTSTKKTKLVEGVDLLDDLISVSAYSDRTFILSKKGIHEVGDEVFLEVKPEWDTYSVLISAFAGNLYVLVKPEGKILRYPGTLSGFAEAQEWFGVGIEPDLSKVVSWAIDGSIWTLDQGGEIDKYSLGVPERFGVVGLDLEFKNPCCIFTEEDYEYVYILDNGNNRIVAIDKNGNYKAEYISDKLADSNGLVVSEDNKKIIFSNGSKLNFFEAKHLK